MRLEHNELLSIEQSLKTYDKLGQRIKQYIIKHKITDAERIEILKENYELSKSMTFNMKTDEPREARKSERFSNQSSLVKMEDSKDRDSHPKGNQVLSQANELSDSFTGSKDQKGSLEQLLNLQNIVLKFLACYLIPTYKRERASQYHKTLKEYVICELQSA